MNKILVLLLVVAMVSLAQKTITTSAKKLARTQQKGIV